MIIILVPILKKKKNSDSFPCASYIYIILTCFIFYFAAEREIEIYRERDILYIMQCFWYQFCLCYALFKRESFIYVQFVCYSCVPRFP